MKRRSKKEIAVAKTLRKRRPKSRTQLVKALDAVFSKYIRLKHSDHQGVVRCFTCQIRKPWEEMHNGHYVSRSVKVLRWDEQNCRPQCAGCNIFHSGRPIDFRENLLNEGIAVQQVLESRRFEVFKVNDSWLQERIDYYNKKLSIII